VELKQKRKEVPDGECAQKGTAIPAAFTSPQQLSGNQSSPLLTLAARKSTLSDHMAYVCAPFSAIHP
jgi:hypothetical protein